MIPRRIEGEFRQFLREYPVVTVLGPRQAGKTTLARRLLPDYGYRNLEDPDDRRFAEDDPRGFLKESPPPVIFDEIQRVPELLSYLQVRVDESPEAGRYVLTGSHQLALRAAITQSLAGRTAVLHLFPLSIEELAAAGHALPDDFAGWAHRGFLPRIHADGLRPTPAYASYYQTYVERDVRQMVALRDASLFDKFLRLLAGRAGQVLNKHALAGDVGVDAKTIDHWLSILEASFIIFKVRPWHENFGKRVIKSPKYYFVDAGLLVFLLGIREPAQVARDPLLGGIFENLVMAEGLKYLANRGHLPEMHFFRDQHGHEVDWLFSDARRFLGIEIKASATPRPSLLDGLRAFDRKIRALDGRLLVYNGAARSHSHGDRFVNFKDLAPALDEWLAKEET